ncbi:MULTISPECIES: PP2C family protein-serine/threonine phosphatase [unclassified Nocardioides]|uniref:PP2C family protein-serine/threonine phosphatase n=1 Tax=unclassified Nocardioides TaxID=2615069 RepID=UPI003605C541
MPFTEEIRLRLAHEAAELGTWHWNADDDSNVWDEQLLRIYGLTAEEFDGSWDTWVGSIYPDDREQALAIVAAAMEDCSAYVLRNRIVRPDGTVRWIEAHGRVLARDDGTPAGTIGCVRDVTDRIELERRQEGAARRAQLLQEVTADFAQASSPEEVAAVHARSLERVRDLVGPHEPSTEDAQLIDTLTSQHWIAAERADLLRRSMEISDELQYSLAASPLPDHDRFEIAAYYAPGGDDLEHVGGDWYDAIETPGGGLVLVVGDVMGRGVRAAASMIHLRAGIRGLLTVESAPAALLHAADQMVSRAAPDAFVTAAVVRLDPLAGTIEVGSAGHLPTVVVHPDATTTMVGQEPGTPLGVPSPAERATDRVALEAGSIVVLVTDGVVESRDRDIDVGMERLRECAVELAPGPLDELVRGVAALADGRLRDDVTVVAARMR